MALQQVNVGAIPNDGTGDDPRTGISKVNANMVLLEATGVNGVDEVFTELNYQPDDPSGRNVARLMANKKGVAISDGEIVDDSVIRFALATSGGALFSSVAPTGGSYKCVAGAEVAIDGFGYFTKVSG